jgi:hypothetical protein
MCSQDSKGDRMTLTGDDWGRLRATPRLVSYLVESPPRSPSPAPCARLILYWKFAKTNLDMLQKIDSLPRPSNFRGPRLADQLPYREDQVALVIENCDIDLRSMLAAQNLTSELTAISHVYARTVVGSENDPNCDQILTSLQQGGLQVPRAGTCG